jgi:Ca2+-binding EF-hand superfamily protein
MNAKRVKSFGMAVVFTAVIFMAAAVLAQPGGGGAASGGAPQSTTKTSKGMEGLIPGQPPDLIAQMDKDKDGKVSKKEWTDWGRPEKLFPKYDKNNNGFIDADEKPTGMPTFELTDINGDGKVTADEFPGPEAMVKQFDKDGNGSLTEDELSSPPSGGGAPGGVPGGAQGNGTSGRDAPINTNK